MSFQFKDLVIGHYKIKIPVFDRRKKVTAQFIIDNERFLDHGCRMSIKTIVIACPQTDMLSLVSCTGSCSEAVYRRQSGICKKDFSRNSAPVIVSEGGRTGFSRRSANGIVLYTCVKEGVTREIMMTLDRNSGKAAEYRIMSGTKTERKLVILCFQRCDPTDQKKSDKYDSCSEHKFL